jgi:hypothetical protein
MAIIYRTLEQREIMNFLNGCETLSPILRGEHIGRRHRKRGVEDIIWTEERRSDRRVDRTA